MRFFPAALLLVCAAARAEEIRIEIGRGAEKARVEVSGRAHEVAVRGAQVLVDGAPGPAEFAGPLKLDGRALAGRLELFADKGGLVAVNVVDLEDYVAAVVASEVPASWPADALRAQAVAARTFAVAQKISQGPGGARPLAAVELRQILGYRELPSLLFEVTVEGDDAVFKGKGSGHGVGLCQWGARGRALKGEGYRAILAHYYPGAEIRRMY